MFTLPENFAKKPKLHLFLSVLSRLVCIVPLWWLTHFAKYLVSDCIHPADRSTTLNVCLSRLSPLHSFHVSFVEFLLHLITKAKTYMENKCSSRFKVKEDKVMSLKVIFFSFQLHNFSSSSTEVLLLFAPFWRNVGILQLSSYLMQLRNKKIKLELLWRNPKYQTDFKINRQLLLRTCTTE